MSNSDLAIATPADRLPAVSLPGWRHGLIVLGSMFGLFGGFAGLYYCTLPFFLVPIGKEFGWGRAELATLPVLSMIGMTLSAPFAGRLFTRFDSGRVIAVSILLLVLDLLAFGQATGSFFLLCALALIAGIVGAPTTMPGYLSVLSRWFDRRLGLALGVAGLGLGLGIALNAQIAALLIGRVGWRGAYLPYLYSELVKKIIPDKNRPGHRRVE